MADPRDNLVLTNLRLTYLDARRLRKRLGPAPQYDGLDRIREQLWEGNGLDPDPATYPWVYADSTPAPRARRPKHPPARGRWRIWQHGGERRSLG